MEEQSETTLKIIRFNPTIDPKPYYRKYAIPWNAGLTVLEAVRYIHGNLDPTLAFNDYYCGRGLCQGCLLEIDGKTQRSCHYLLEKDSSVVVGPPEAFPVIRDLRVDFGVPVRGEPGGEILWMKDGARVEAASKSA